MYRGKITNARKRRKYDLGRESSDTTIGERRIKQIRVRGGNKKVKIITEKYANVLIDKKPVKCEILSVVENPANKEFTRRNIITKGAILKAKTPEGNEIRIKVMSRPGQDGLLNAISLL